MQLSAGNSCFSTLAVPGAADDEEIEILDIDARTSPPGAEGSGLPDLGEGLFFWMEPRSAEPGDKIALFPYWADIPGRLQ
ncbi:MAG: hypothetical protein R3C04_06700 [Hyphomonas sp.]